MLYAVCCVHTASSVRTLSLGSRKVGLRESAQLSSIVSPRLRRLSCSLWNASSSGRISLPKPASLIMS